MKHVPTHVTRSVVTLSLGLTLAVAAAPLVSAQTLTQPGAAGSAATSAANTPSRGMTMNRVESAFGAPSSRVPAIGDPPITRWEYPGFVVFFEHQHVIHTVVR